MNADIPDVSFCYVTTRGRVSGRPHEIEIWYGLSGRTLHLLAGGGDSSDWVRNLDADPRVQVRIEDGRWEATARRVTDTEEDRTARRALAAKYQGWEEGQPLTDWAQHALCIAVDLEI